MRLVEDEPTVAVQVLWRGAELNLNRAREEPLGRFLQRLGLSCCKYAGRQAGGDKKRAKKEKKKPMTEGDAQDGTEVVAVPVPQSNGLLVGLLNSEGVKVPDNTPVAEALAGAAHIDIEGERLPIVVNPPSIQKFEVFGKPLAGCPLVASVRCEFCEPSDFRLRWLRQASAGGDPSGPCAGEGRVFWVPEDMVGQTLTLCAVKGAVTASNLAASAQCGRTRKVLRIGAVEEVPPGWPDRRLRAFGPRRPAELRVVCYNILAAYYSQTQVATRSMYPYCPPTALDFAYRQPLIGRELARLDADIVFLQECSFSTFRKFLVPLFGDRFHVRVTLKASKVSEGCVVLVRKEAFDVIEDKDVLFRKLFRSSAAFRPALCEVAAKWPNFLRGVLPHMTTIFQLSVVRHVQTSEVLVLANTHLFFHPLAKHIRLLQIMCLLQQVQELREQHRAEGAELPRVIFGGDLNCNPETAVVKLLLEGKVPSDHSDWEHAKQFAWRDDDEGAGGADEDDDGNDAPIGTSAPSMEAEAGDDVEPLPQEKWQPGLGLALQNPIGAMSNAYADVPLPFTNYVHGFNGILDWILTAGRFRVVRTLGDVTEEDILPQGGLPSLQHPSDHLSLAVDLVLE